MYLLSRRSKVRSRPFCVTQTPASEPDTEHLSVGKLVLSVTLGDFTCIWGGSPGPLCFPFTILMLSPFLLDLWEHIQWDTKQFLSVIFKIVSQENMLAISVGE